MVNKHDAPVVAYLYEHQRDSGKFLKTRTISPQMFELMMKIVKNYPHILGISGNDIVALQWVYRLAFRLGLRIDEVTGIRLNDFDSAQLRSHLKIIVYITKQSQILKIRLQMNHPIQILKIWF